MRSYKMTLLGLSHAWLDFLGLGMCLCVCTCAHTCVHMHLCVHMDMHVCVCVCMGGEGIDTGSTVQIQKQDSPIGFHYKNWGKQ